MKRFLQEIGQTNTWRVVEKAYVNGYAFGDRLLEDVFFEITIVKSRVKAEVIPEHAEYLADLNAKKWTAAAAKFARETDVLMSKPGGEHDVVLYDDATSNEIFVIVETPA